MKNTSGDIEMLAVRWSSPTFSVCVHTYAIKFPMSPSPDVEMRADDSQVRASLCPFCVYLFAIQYYRTYPYTGYLPLLLVLSLHASKTPSSSPHTQGPLPQAQQNLGPRPTQRHFRHIHHLIPHNQRLGTCAQVQQHSSWRASLYHPSHLAHESRTMPR